MSNKSVVSKRIINLKHKEGENPRAYVKLNKTVYDRVMSETMSEAMVVRLAKSLSAFLKEKEIVIDEYELLAGHAKVVDCYYSHPYENQRELDSILSGTNAGLISTEDKKIAELFVKGTTIGLYQRWPSGHVIGGYENVLKNGFGYIIKKASCILDVEEYNKKEFATAALITCEAASDYIMRYAMKARENINLTDIDENKQQLKRIADSCEWISVNPARNFFEAVQLLWLTHEVIVFEQVSGSLSLGRIDQYLLPYYASDIAAGNITYESAKEIIEALWVKFSGLKKAFQNVTLGGIDKNGNYLVNDLSFICLQVTKNLKMDQPLVSVRWHKNIPEAFWDEVQELIEVGLGFPALFNDEVCIEAKRRIGVLEEDAQNYGIIGCVEMAVPGKEFGHTEGYRINWAKVLELLLNKGTCTVTGKKMPLSSHQNIESIMSFEEFYAWYKTELLYFLDLGLKAVNFLDSHYSQHYPTPFLSSLMEGCLEKGGDVTAGTTVYNFSSANAVGMSNLTDSLVVIKKIIFNDRKVTLTKLSEILRNNFEGEEIFQKELVLKSSKFGNDQDEADIFMKELSQIFCKYVDGFSNPRKGRFQPGLYSVETQAFMGKLTGALPDGRSKGKYLANALSPVQGVDILGPTAVIKSITKLDHAMFGNGMVLDLKFHPTFFENNKHRQAFKHLVETYFELGGMEIQFNVVSREMLISAQNSPEEYRDLIVRVSGFSAYFVTLDRVLQDEIVARTEYRTL